LLVVGAWIATVLLQEAYLAGAVRTFGASWYQGRYLFPVLPVIAATMSIGLLSLVSARCGFRRS
jgi:hypothetical protein